MSDRVLQFDSCQLLVVILAFMIEMGVTAVFMSVIWRCSRICQWQYVATGSMSLIICYNWVHVTDRALQ